MSCPRHENRQRPSRQGHPSTASIGLLAVNISTPRLRTARYPSVAPLAGCPQVRHRWSRARPSRAQAVRTPWRRTTRQRETELPVCALMRDAGFTERNSSTKIQIFGAAYLNIWWRTSARPWRANRWTTHIAPSVFGPKGSNLQTYDLTQLIGLSPCVGDFSPRCRHVSFVRTPNHRRGPPQEKYQ
ncbi:hypothetical protein ACVW16_001309 [Bradyrhizobium sp. USDA 4474]